MCKLVSSLSIHLDKLRNCGKELRGGDQWKGQYEVPVYSFFVAVFPIVLLFLFSALIACMLCLFGWIIVHKWGVGIDCVFAFAFLILKGKPNIGRCGSCWIEVHSCNERWCQTLYLYKMRYPLHWKV